MHVEKLELRIIFALFLGLAVFVPNAIAKDKPNAAAAADPGSSTAVPADRETLDLDMYQRIREEGLYHSHIMGVTRRPHDGWYRASPHRFSDYAPCWATAWTQGLLIAMGCSNAHLESWGEFGMGWQQLNAWARMTAPDTAVFIAQAAPWSPATAGPVTGQAIWLDVKNEKDLEKYKGKLTGKIVLLGDMREVGVIDKPLLTRNGEQELKDAQAYPLSDPDAEFGKFLEEYLARIALRGKIGKFAAEEHAVAILVPSRDGARNGGSGGTIFDDSGEGLDWFAYRRDHIAPLPIMVTAIESYGRVYRLLKANVPVSIELNVDTAEMPGDWRVGIRYGEQIPARRSEVEG